MAINTKKRGAAAKNKVSEESPKKLKTEAVEVPKPKKGKKPSKKAGENGSTVPPQKAKEAEVSNGNSPVKSEGKKKRNKKKGKQSVAGQPAKKSAKSPEQIQKSQKEFKAVAAKYLNQWKNDKSNWKFSKNTQYWIIVHLFETEMVDDTSFDIAVSYFEGAVGFSRNKVLECAVNLVKSFEKKTSLNEAEQQKMDRAQRIAKIGVEVKKAAASPNKKKGKAAAATPKAKTPAKKGKKKAAAAKEEEEEEEEESD